MKIPTPDTDRDRHGRHWIRRCGDLLLGAGLMGGAVYVTAEVPFVEVSRWWGLLGRMLAVLGAGMIVAAFSAHPVRAVVGAVIGVLVARVWGPMASANDTLEELDASLYLCVVPASMASFSNWRVGAAAAATTLAVGLPAFLLRDGGDRLVWNPFDPQWWRDWSGLASIAFCGAATGLVAWSVGWIAMYAGVRCWEVSQADSAK